MTRWTGVIAVATILAATPARPASARMDLT
jgi:hypothetical protein